MKRLAKAGQLTWRLRNAEALGEARGRADKHYETGDFGTGAEYIAWLRGWRRGQAALKAEQRAAAAEQARLERIMRNLLEAA
jgi:hypothetical protein